MTIAIYDFFGCVSFVFLFEIFMILVRRFITTSAPRMVADASSTQIMSGHRASLWRITLHLGLVVALS
jgi:hypothetical protein